MGIDCVTFQRLVELAGREDVFVKRGLMLGRQVLRYQRRYRAQYKMTIDASPFDLDIADFKEEGYAEPFFEKIGFGKVEAMDFSDFEGAQHVHDLNHPVPDDLRGKFDFILDGGTIEHVFNTPAALTNVFDMLKPGGVFASANGMNGWMFHGLYQFNPELVYSFWERSAGCEVLRCCAMSTNPRNKPIDLPDAAPLGRRLRRSKTFPEGRVYLYYEVRKPEGAKLTGPALQSDYQARWDRAGSGAEPELEEA